MLISNLACGPMSKEIIEAIFMYSDQHNKPLMLIASRNQVDKTNGYVFTTEKYMKYICRMKIQYPSSHVMICRDHCGPNFGSETEVNFDGTKETIRCDLENGFDLIHIDLCLTPGMSHQDKILHTTKLMQYALSIRSDVVFEIGTDENIGETETNVKRIISDIRTCQHIANPMFYVVQTGSLVYRAENVGSFREDVIAQMYQALHNCGTRLKEHNADYLTTEQLYRRRGIVDAVNIAPQLGVLQTSHILSRAMVYGIDTKPFINHIIYSKKWQKWNNASSNHLLCTIVAGHYHFNESEYNDLINQLEKKCDIHESIIKEIINVVEHYSISLEVTL